MTATLTIKIVYIGLGDLLLLGHANALVTTIAPPAARARYLSAYGTSWGIAAIVGPATGTQLLAHAGPASLWATCAGCCLLLAAGQPLIGRYLRRRQPAAQRGTTTPRALPRR